MAEQVPFHLEYIPINISLRSVGTASLPVFLGSTLRGVIGHALQTNQAIRTYLYRNHRYSSYQKDIANPYIIVPPINGRTLFNEGDPLHFQVLLLGEAAQYTQSFIEALQGERMLGLGAARHPFLFEKAVHGSSERIIWQNGVFSFSAIQTVSLPYITLSDISQLIIQTCTPLRIRRNGVLLETIDFLTIIRNITRRIETIATRYGGNIVDAEVQRILGLASEISTVCDHLQVQHLSRYSNNLKEKMDFSGLAGRIQFEGDLEPFVPWLYAGQILHIGRNTTFGMGRIQVDFLQSVRLQTDLFQ